MGNVLSVVKRQDHYRIRNLVDKKTYPTKYESRQSANRKKRVIEHWFKKRRARSALQV